MKILRVLWALSMAGALAAAMAVTGCSSKTMQKMFVPNQPPTVRLTSAPYDTAGRYFYAYKLNWIGNDPGQWDSMVAIPEELPELRAQVIEAAEVCPGECIFIETE